MITEVIQGSLLDVDADAIVNPANSLGRMGGGAAGVIKRAAGVEVEEEAVSKAPIPVGEAVVTSGGKTKFRGIVHAPTMELPAQRIPARNVSLATAAALKAADDAGFSSLAIPGMGTGVGGVSKDDAAEAMLDAIAEFRGLTLRRIKLVDVDQAMCRAWEEALEGTER